MYVRKWISLCVMHPWWVLWLNGLESEYVSRNTHSVSIEKCLHSLVSCALTTDISSRVKFDVLSAVSISPIILESDRYFSRSCSISSHRVLLHYRHWFWSQFTVLSAARSSTLPLSIRETFRLVTYFGTISRSSTLPLSIRETFRLVTYFGTISSSGCFTLAIQISETPRGHSNCALQNLLRVKVLLPLDSNMSYSIYCLRRHQGSWESSPRQKLGVKLIVFISRALETLVVSWIWWCLSSRPMGTNTDDIPIAEGYSSRDVYNVFDQWAVPGTIVSDWLREDPA